MSRWKSLLRIDLALVLVAFICSGCGANNDVTVLKLAHTLDVHHPVHQAMVHMAERLDEYSEGSMRLDIYSSGQLGSERELMELLQIGSLAMTKVSSSPMEGFVPAMKIFSIPYVFKDKDHFWRVLNGPIGQEMLLAGQAVRLKGLAYYDAGSRSFYSVNRPIRSPSDLSGLKIRVQESATALQMVRSLGGSATPVSWGELYTALQQGIVDGAENNPPSFYLSKHFEVARFYTQNEHTMVPDILLISQYVWDRLQPEQQQWLQQAVDDSVLVQRKLWEEATRTALEAVAAAGVEIIHPDKSDFIRQVQPMHDALRGTPTFDLLQRIRDF